MGFMAKLWREDYVKGLALGVIARKNLILRSKMLRGKKNNFLFLYGNILAE